MTEKEKNKRIHSVYSPFTMLFLAFESPFYPGSARSEKGIDLRVQRNAKNLPTYYASGLKGAFRNYYRLNSSEEEAKEIFGHEDHVGKIIFSDAHLLFFPVQSTTGFFAYVTSPYVLHRFCRQLQEIGVSVSPPTLNPPLTLTESLVVPRDGENHVLLLDGSFDFNVNIAKAATRDQLQLILSEITDVISAPNGYSYMAHAITERLLLVSDEDFQTLTERGTEKVTRIELDYDTKTTKRGSLFTQELIPEASLFYSTLYQPYELQNTKAFGFFEDLFTDHSTILNFGGDETLGRGRGRVFLKKSQVRGGDS